MAACRMYRLGKKLLQLRRRTEKGKLRDLQQISGVYTWERKESAYNWYSKMNSSSNGLINSKIASIKVVSGKLSVVKIVAGWED